MKIERTAAFDHPTGAVQHAFALDMAVAFGLEPVDVDPGLIDWDNDVPPYPVLSGEVARARATTAERAIRFERPRSA